jgi:hypothetical protein
MTLFVSDAWQLEITCIHHQVRSSASQQFLTSRTPADGV